MNLIDRERHDMLVRVRDFGTTYGHLFPESSLAAQAFAALTCAITDIDSNDVAETMAAITARAARKSQARDGLRTRLQLIAHTARVIDEADAELHAHFTLPEKKSDQLLLTAARQFLQRATPLATEFVAHGMPPGFLADLATLTQMFEEALRDRGMGRDRLVAARTSIREALNAAFKALRQLDVIVANHLATNPAVCEVWTRSRRVRNPYRREKWPDAQASSEPSPTPVPSPIVATD